MTEANTTPTTKPPSKAIRLHGPCGDYFGTIVVPDLAAVDEATRANLTALLQDAYVESRPCRNIRCDVAFQRVYHRWSLLTGAQSTVVRSYEDPRNDPVVRAFAREVKHGDR